MNGIKNIQSLGRRVSLILLFLSFCATTFGQGVVSELTGSITSEDVRGGLEGAKIDIYKNGSKFETVSVDSKGRFNIKLEPGAVYKMEFTYPGHVTKRMEYDSRGLTPDQEYGGYFKFDVSLFQERDGLDVSILNKPIGKLFYNPELGDVDFDKAYTQSIKSELDRLKSELDAKLKAEEDAKKEEEEGYAKAIAAADKAMSSKDYLKAKQEYTRALSYKPDESYPQNQLEQARKLYDDAQAAKEKEAEYKEAIEAAEFALYEEDLKKAEEEFDRALSAKPGDKYAKDQIKEVRDKMLNEAKSEQLYVIAIEKADAALAARDLITAKGEYDKAAQAKPSEEYPKGQLDLVNSMIKEDANKEKNYIEAIGKADAAFDINDFESAKAAYARASEIKPNEKYPKDQLATVEKKIAELAELNKSYDDAIKAGDDAFGSNKFDDAKASYKKAADLKPDQQYPKDQLAAIDKKVEELAKVEAEYQEIIKGADERYNIKEYVAAKAEYTKALALRPGEEHPTKRLEEVTRLLNEQAEQEEAYKAAIENADNAFNAKDFLSAKIEYENALKIKPEESYPKDQLEIALTNIKQAEQLEGDYNTAIEEGDAALGSEDFASAKTAFEKALSLKPDEKYPKEKIAEIDGKLVELENANKKYQEIIASADKALEANELKSAQESYREALGIKPSEQYPKDQIAKIDGLMADAQEKEAGYTAAIEAGDKAFEGADYSTSKAEYEKALALKPEEKYPTDRIAEIEKLAAEQAEKDQQYTDLIKTADDAYNASDFENAKATYQEAAGVKPDESYPKERIADIEGKLEGLAKQEEEYAQALKEAEGAEKAEDYAAAKTFYETASGIKPEEQLPKDKIAELSALLSQAEELENNYKEAIKLADEAFDTKEYDIAKTSYEKAAELKPTETHPKDRLAEIEKIKADEAAAIELANKSQEEYDELIATGDAAMEKSEFEAARTAYQSALEVKAEEQYPKDQLAAIDAKIAELEAQASADAELAKKKEEYDDIIKEADKAFNAKEYDGAIAKYEEAKNVLPDETYPSDQIAKINQIKSDEAAAIELAGKEQEEKYNGFISVADGAFDTQNYDVALTNYRSALEIKPEESHPQNRIAEISDLQAAAGEKEKQYEGLISSADKAFKAKDYEAAKTDYNAALGLKPGEEHPTSQLTEIERLITEAEANAAKEQEAAAAKEIEEKYNGLIATADKAFKSKEYEDAKSAYQAALEVKTAEQYPADQIAEIDRLVSEAADLAEREKAEAASKEKEAQYKNFISSADKAFKAADYSTAKTNYESALGVKPGEEYPTTQIGEIDRLIAEAAANDEREKAAAAAKEIEERYNNAIAAGDKAFKGKDYESARTNYNEALEVKAGEQYPTDQLKEIDRLILEASALAEKEKSEAAAKEKEKQYNGFIANADKSFKSKKYEEAKSAYESALGIKPGEQHPTDRISEINGILSSRKASEEKEANYQRLITQGDSDFDAAKFAVAKTSYEKALTIKPDESYPQERLDLIAEELAKLDEMALAEAEKNRKLEAKYAGMITDGDNAMNNEDYEKATGLYKSALGLKPGEQYPQDQINKISKLMTEKSETDKAAAERKAMLAKYDEQILKGDRALSAKNYKGATDAYRAALSIQPDEGYPKRKINEINDILSAKEAVAVKKVEEKPRAKVTGKSDEDIAAMMAEMVRKREEAKLERVRKLTQDVQDSETARMSDAGRRREDAQLDIQDIESEVVAMNETKKEIYGKRVEETEVYTEQVMETREGYVENADDRRTNASEGLDKLAEDVKESNAKGNELHLLSAEKIATRKIELEQVENNYIADASNRRGVALGKINDKIEYKQNMKDKGEGERIKNKEELTKFEKDLYGEREDRVKKAQGRREKVMEEQEELVNQVAEWNSELNNLHITKAKQLNEEQEAIADSRNSQTEAADQRIENNQNAIKEYTEEVEQLTKEKNNSYNENNQKVQQRTDEINNYQEELSGNADAKIEAYKVDYYSGQTAKPRQSDNASKYPQGVTEETYEEGNSIVIKRFVVTGETMDEYEKIYYTWGGVFYKKNGADITQEIWDEETK